MLEQFGRFLAAGDQFIGRYLAQLRRKDLFQYAYVYGYDEVKAEKFAEMREVFGDIRASSEQSSMLVISEAAVVQGEVHADHVIVNGTVRGPVIARELLELQPKARIEGDVSYMALEMHQGAVISGQLKPLMVDGAEEKPLLKLAAKTA